MCAAITTVPPEHAVASLRMALVMSCTVHVVGFTPHPLRVLYISAVRAFLYQFKSKNSLLNVFVLFLDRL